MFGSVNFVAKRISTQFIIEIRLATSSPTVMLNGFSYDSFCYCICTCLDTETSPRYHGAL